MYKIPFHTLILSYNNVRLNTSPPHDDSSNAFLDFELKKPISGKQVNVKPKTSQAQDLVKDPAALGLVTLKQERKGFGISLNLCFSSQPDIW